MISHKTKGSHLHALRRQAEDGLTRSPDGLQKLHSDDVNQLIHELQTHQIELDIQNEELRDAQIEIIESRDMYSDLYDFAPVGYATISHQGLILKANLTLTQMLGVRPKTFVKTPFSSFIIENDQDIFYQHRGEIIRTNQPGACQLRLRKTDGKQFWAEMRTTPVENAQLRTIISDITKRKSAEENALKINRHLHAYREIATLRNADIKKIVEFIPTTIAEMTRSDCGFFGLLTKDESAIEIHVWSAEAIKGSQAVETPTHFPIAEAGIWGETVGQRRPIILNDFTCATPTPEGLPEGHVPLSNLLAVPVFSGKKIVGLGGVANRFDDYTAEDAEQIGSLCENAWILFERKIAEKAEQARERALEEATRKKIHVEALLEGAQAVLKEGIDIPANIRRIFNDARKMTGARDGFVALLSKDGNENEFVVLELDRLPSGYTLDESVLKPLGCQVSNLFQDAQCVYDNNFRQSKWAKLQSKIQPIFRNIMFAPLNIDQETVGIMGLANKDGAFTEDDRVMAQAFGQLAALSLKNSRDRESLAQSAQSLQEAQKIAHIGHWQYDIKTENLDWSEELFRIHGLTPAGNITLDEGFSRVHPSDLAFANEVFEQAVGHGQPYEIEYRIIKPDEEERVLKSIGKIKRDPEGNVVKITGTSQDITEEKKSQNILLNNQRLESLALLAGGIAHDFNNLLTGIFGNIDLVRNAIDNRFAALEFLNRAMKALDRAKDLTSQLLTFSKGGSPKKEGVSIKELIEESRSLALSGSNISCDLVLSQDLTAVEADPNQLSQVFNNIFLNARQAMPMGGNMTVSARNRLIQRNEISGLQPGDYVELSFVDEGTGIPEEILDKVFDPFFSTKKKGSGLGLATSYSIIKQHGGIITVSSKAAFGTSIVINLPASKEPASSDSTVAPSMEYMGLNRKILVMDDEEMLRDLAVEMLGLHGFEVVCTSSGEEAIQLFEQKQKKGYPFDLVMLDLTVPGGIGGAQAMSRLREIDPNVLGIVASGYADSPVLSCPRNYGFAGKIEKPYSKEDLFRVIIDVLAMNN